MSLKQLLVRASAWARRARVAFDQAEAQRRRDEPLREVWALGFCGFEREAAQLFRKLRQP